MASVKDRKKVGPSFVGGKDGPDRLVCPGGRLEPKFVVSVAYICSMADRTDDVFREPTSFLISHDWVSLVRRRDTTPELACRRLTLAAYLDGGQSVPAGAAPARRSFARDALEDGRKMRLRAEADGQRDLGQRHFGIRQ